MDDALLIAISLCVAAAGMTGLLFAIIFYELPFSTIQDAAGAAEGTVVQLKATVRTVQHRSNITIMTISQPATIDVTIFEDVNITAGSCIIVQGKRSSFNDQPQLTATRVKIC